MLKHKVWITATVTILLLLATSSAVVLAQDTGGTIKGKVFYDLDANGQCVGTGERGMQGVVVTFTNTQAAIQSAIATDQEGSFGYTSAGYGTWNITVQSPDGWYVSSQETRQTALTSNQPVVTGLDFCIAQGKGPGAGGTTTKASLLGPLSSKTAASGSAMTLPESGAPIAPGLMIAGLAAIGLLTLGMGLYIYSRRSTA